MNSGLLLYDVVLRLFTKKQLSVSLENGREAI